MIIFINIRLRQPHNLFTGRIEVHTHKITRKQCIDTVTACPYDAANVCV